VDNPPLHALANSASANGVYAYGGIRFPMQSYDATNYWVDVMFNLSSPRVSHINPFRAQEGLSFLGRPSLGRRTAHAIVKPYVR
jgi:hypothetical protein